MSTQPVEAAATSLVVREQVAIGARGIALTSLDELYRFAKVVAFTEFVPKDFRGKPESVMVAIQYGMELGFTPMASLQSLHVINGKVATPGDSMLALVENSGLLVDFEESFEGEGEALNAICKVQRVGRRPHIEEFSWSDAVRAGLPKRNPQYDLYPKRMLRNRCRGFALRDVFPDVLKGLYSREEALDFAPEPSSEPPNGNGADAAPKSRVDAMKQRLAASQGRPVDGHAAADDALDSAARSAALGSDPEPDAIEAEEEKPEPEPATEPEQPKGRKRAARPETPQPEKPAEDATIGRIAIGRLVDLTEKWTPADLADFYAEFGVESFEQLRSSIYNEAIGYVDARNGNDAPGVEGPGMFDADPATISIATDVDAAGLDETARERFKSWLPHWIESFEAVPVADVEKSKLLLVIFQLCRATDSDINKALTVYRDASCIAELTIEQLRTVQASLEKKAANLAAAGGE